MACALCVQLLVVFNMGPIISKHIKVRFAYSEEKLTELFKPLKFSISNSYTYFLVSVALGLICAPALFSLSLSLCEL